MLEVLVWLNYTQTAPNNIHAVIVSFTQNNFSSSHCSDTIWHNTVQSIQNYMHNVITSIHAHVITIANLSFEMAGTLNVLLLSQVRYNTDLVIELNLTTILSAEIFLYNYSLNLKTKNSVLGNSLHS